MKKSWPMSANRYCHRHHAYATFPAIRVGNDPARLGLGRQSHGRTAGTLPPENATRSLNEYLKLLIALVRRLPPSVKRTKGDCRPNAYLGLCPATAYTDAGVRSPPAERHW